MCISVASLKSNYFPLQFFVQYIHFLALTTWINVTEEWVVFLLLDPTQLMSPVKKSEVCEAAKCIHS
jgi:hypothetical protein